MACKKCGKTLSDVERRARLVVFEAACGNLIRAEQSIEAEIPKSGDELDRRASEAILQAWKAALPHYEASVDRSLEQIQICYSC